MSERTKKILCYVFFGAVIAGLVLAIAGMLAGEVAASMEISSVVAGTDINATLHDTLGLFDELWGVDGAPGNAFLVFSFIVLLLGSVAAVTEGVLRLFAKRRIRLLAYISAGVVLLGGVLVLIAGLVAAGGFEGGTTTEAGVTMKLSYSAGAGVWLGFVAGLVGGACALIPALKPFAE